MKQILIAIDQLVRRDAEVALLRRQVDIERALTEGGADGRHQD